MCKLVVVKCRVSKDRVCVSASVGKAVFAGVPGSRAKSVETLGSQNLALKSWSWNLRNASRRNLVKVMEKIVSLWMVCVTFVSKRKVRNS